MLGGEFKTFLQWCEKPLRKALRVNTRKVSSEVFLARARERGWHLIPIPWSKEGYWIDRENREVPLGKSVEHYGGWFYLQDPASMIPPEVMKAQEGEWILDLAAAPGGKTLHISSTMQEKGILIANDVSAQRIKGLVSNLDRMGAVNVAVAQLNGNQWGRLFPNTFHQVLLDAPCSAEGTIRKDSFALEHWSLRVIEKMARQQQPLILSAFQCLRSGGTLVYSTCTLSPEENERVVDFLLRKFPNNAMVVEWELPGLLTSPGVSEWEGKAFVQAEKTKRIYPHQNDTEGFFVAKIRKQEETHARKMGYHTGSEKSNLWRLLSKQERHHIFLFLYERYGIPEETFDGFELVEAGRSLWLWKTEWIKVAKRFPFIRYGLRLVSRYEKKRPAEPFTLKLSTWAVQRFGPFAQRNILNLSGEETAQYLEGKDISLSSKSAEISEGIVLVRGERVFLGTGLLKGNLLKNQLPRYSLVL